LEVAKSFFARQPLPIMAFGTEVRRIRKLRKLSIEDLAERSKLSANYVGGIEMNRRDPSMSTVKALSKGLGVSMADLFQDTPDSVSPSAMQLAKAFERIRPNLQEVIMNLVVSLASGPGSLPPRKAPPARGGKQTAARKR
jgi:transcriptional regulator with XRE-family HTH domain